MSVNLFLLRLIPLTLYYEVEAYFFMRSSTWFTFESFRDELDKSTTPEKSGLLSYARKISPREDPAGTFFLTGPLIPLLLLSSFGDMGTA